MNKHDKYLEGLLIIFSPQPIGFCLNLSKTSIPCRFSALGLKSFIWLYGVSSDIANIVVSGLKVQISFSSFSLSLTCLATHSCLLVFGRARRSKLSVGFSSEPYFLIASYYEVFEIFGRWSNV